MTYDDAVLNQLVPEDGEWPKPTTPSPTETTVQYWHDAEGGCEATDGCWVKPDGVCEHGHPSWLLHWGVI